MKRVGCIFALSLCFVSPGLAAPKLHGYAIDINQTSVSGVSSGGAMAVQMHVAYSSIMRGVGVIAGVAYGCADPRKLTAGERVVLGLLCMDASSNAAFSIDRTNDAVAVGAIDKPAMYLPGQKVWLFSGNNDGTVRRAAMNAVNQYYKSYVNSSNVFYQISNPAPHAIVTAKFGGPCLSFDARFINNCGYDAAGLLLQHIYGRLNPPSSKRSLGSMLKFDQAKFVKLVDPTLIPAFIGLAGSGRVYVPKACKTDTCRVHIVFHGCKQNEATVGNAVYKNAGYNEWAATNKIIVLYPQTVVTVAPVNPYGCWDWWGLNDALPRSRDFARQTGYQIAVFKAMLDQLASGAPHPAASSGAFGMPQNFQVADSSTNSVALIWQANSAAQGFNIYRLSSNGQYEKINNGPISGASFADQGLTASTTYHYKISAINGAGSESALTNEIAGKTAAEPPACDPYFSDNVTHLKAKRADPSGLNVVAHGSQDPMGLLITAAEVSTQLMKTQPDVYRVGYCQ